MGREGAISTGGDDAGDTDTGGTDTGGTDTDASVTAALEAAVLEATALDAAGASSAGGDSGALLVARSTVTLRTGSGTLTGSREFAGAGTGPDSSSGTTQYDERRQDRSADQAFFDATIHS